MENVSFKEIMDFQKKSKIKAGEGLPLGEGKYPFYTSSPVLSKSINVSTFEGENLVFGTGGLPSIHFAEGNFASSTDCLVTKVKDDNQVFAKFVYYYLNGNINILADGFKGAGLKHISKEYIENIKIPLPELSVQKKIAAILDKAAEIRETNQKIVDKYEQLKQSLFLEMFGDPVKNEKGWDVKTIEDLIKKEKNSLKRGPFGGALKKEIFVEDGYLVYEQYHALNNDFSMARYFIDDSKFEELKGFEVKPNDIIVSCSGVYLGKLAIVPENARKGIINQALLKITLDEKIMKNEFFVFHFSHRNFKNKYFDSNRGAGIPNFPPMSDFKKFPFICPPQNLQNKFFERIENIDLQLNIAQENLKKTDNLFNALLQKAFSGNLIKN